MEKSRKLKKFKSVLGVVIGLDTITQLLYCSVLMPHRWSMHTLIHNMRQ